MKEFGKWRPVHIQRKFWMNALVVQNDEKLPHFEEECKELCGLLIARMTHTNRDVTVVSLSCTCHGNS